MNSELEHLNMAVAPFILRRKKVDVAKDLPAKLDKKIVIDLTEEQKKVYYAHLELSKKEIEVVKFVCQGTIEERILELQDRKKKLSDGILEHEDRDKVILSKLTEKDIKRLLDM